MKSTLCTGVRRASSSRVVWVVAAVMVVVPFLVTPLVMALRVPRPSAEASGLVTAEEREALRALIVQTRDAAEQRDAARREAVAEALTAPLPELAEPCQVTGKNVLGEWKGEDVVPSVSSTVSEMMRRVNDVWVSTNGPQDDEGPKMAAAGALDGLDKQLGGDVPMRPAELAAAATRVDEARLPYTLSLVIDVRVDARATSATTFDPGMLRGRLYLWSRSDQRLLCATPVVMRSPEQSVVRRDPNGVISADAAVSSRLFMELLVSSVVFGVENLKRLPADGAQD